MEKRDEVELLIIEWLQSGNENTTHIADEICKIFNPKKKPLSERKEAFRLNTFKYLDRYSESMMIEFFEYWTTITVNDKMRFEYIDNFNIEEKLKE